MLKRLKIPHPKMRAIAKPRSQKTAQVPVPRFVSQSSRAHKRLRGRRVAGIEILPCENLQIGHYQTESASRREHRKRISKSDVKIAEREMFQHMTGINCRTRFSNQRQPLNDIAVLDIAWKPFCIFCVQLADDWQSLESQSRRRIKISPALRSRKAASELNAQFGGILVHLRCRSATYLVDC